MDSKFPKPAMVFKNISPNDLHGADRVEFVWHIIGTNGRKQLESGLYQT